jgi:hypothetical protein
MNATDRTTATLRRLRAELTAWLASRSDVGNVEVRCFGRREYDNPAQTLDNASSEIDVTYHDDDGNEGPTIRINLSAIDKAD